MPSPRKDAAREAEKYLTIGKKRFIARCKEKTLNFQMSVREAAIVISGDVPPYTASEAFLNTLQVYKPHHTGWTPWLDSRNSQEADFQPYVYQKGWEALIVWLDNTIWGKSIDFWRINPRGRFYDLRGLEDDLRERSDRAKYPTRLLSSDRRPLRRYCPSVWHSPRDGIRGNNHVSCVCVPLD